MSTAFYPLGMRQSMPASGYSQHSTYLNKQYLPWKGTGPFSNPVGAAASHIRPLTNKDSGNVFQSGSFPSRTYSNTRVFIPRPLKHYRKGKVIPSTPIEGVPNLVGASPYNKSITVNIPENDLINYNMNRIVASSKGTSLGGGFGGSGLLNELQDKPGSYIVKQNPPNELSGVNQLDTNCKSCEGVGVVVNYYPNTTYLTDNPEKNTTNPILCCNPEYKARQRVIYASTNLSKSYYTTTKQYLQNRCKTYEQKAFNYLSYNTLNNSVYNSNPYYISLQPNNSVQAGSPLSLANTYLANCQTNAEQYNATQNAMIAQMLSIMLNQNIITQSEIIEFNSLNINSISGLFAWINGLPESQKPGAISVFTNYISNPYTGMPLAGPSNPSGCQLVVYKPNNYQYAKQGAVGSSTKILKLMVDTISTNAAAIQSYKNTPNQLIQNANDLVNPPILTYSNTGPELVNANELYAGSSNYNNLLKNKAPSCNTPYPLNFRQSGPFQNKKFCYYNNLQVYKVPISQPSPYRYYPGTVFNTNHYSQSPNTYNTTTGSASYTKNIIKI
jgi:hypothetical protein